MNKTVSIVTPVYNAESHVGDTIQSVLAQTYPNWELLLIDDHSTDDSLYIVQDYAHHYPRIKWYRTINNSGAAITRNIGIERATGRFIAFLDSDDLWHNEKLRKQTNFMLENDNTLSHTDYTFIDEIGSLTGKTIMPPNDLTYQQMLHYNYIGCLTAMYDTQKLGKVYMPEIDKRQDYALWLKIMRQGYSAHALHETLAYYRSGKKSLSSNKWRAALYNYRILTSFEGLPHYKALYYFLHYVMTGLRKYLVN